MVSNFSLYHIFNIVAESGNISHAAKQLYISQPAVSKAIAQLEDNLQTTLFVRGSRGVRLTEEGKLLYDHTKQAFDILEKGESSIRRIHELGIGTLRIGVSSSLCKYLLLPYLNQFVETYPHIKITIESQSSSHTLAQLDTEELDIGLVAKPDKLGPYHFESLGTIEDTFVATKSYLEHLKLRDGTEDLFRCANIMLLDKENVSRQYINDYFTQHHIAPKQILEVTSMELLIEFAKIGLGVACVIKDFVKNELESGLLVEIPLKEAIKKREVGFSYSKNAFLSDSMERFLSFVHTIDPLGDPIQRIK